MEGVVDLWRPLLIPETLDSLLVHHYAVNICNIYVCTNEKARGHFRGTPPRAHSDRNEQIRVTSKGNLHKMVHTVNVYKKLIPNHIYLRILYSLLSTNTKN